MLLSRVLSHGLSAATPDPSATSSQDGSRAKQAALASAVGDAVQRHRLERLFLRLDQNKDGRIDPEELARSLRKYGYSHITKDQVKASFKALSTV